VSADSGRNLGMVGRALRDQPGLAADEDVLRNRFGSRSERLWPTGSPD
jgi:hypothetical protein